MPHPSLTGFGYQTTPIVLSSHRLLISAGSVHCRVLRCMSVLACVCEPVSGRESALRPVSSMLGIVLNLCASSVICIVEYQWPPPHAPSPRDARTRSQTAGSSPVRYAPRRSAMWRSGSQCASVFIRNKLRHCQLYILRYYGTVSHLKISSHIGIGGVQSLRTSRSSPCSRLSSVRVPCAAPAAHIRSPVHRDRAPRAVGVVAHS